MTQTQPPETHTEAVGIFADADALQAAIDELLISGFDRAELSLLANADTVEQKLGHAYKKVTELEDDDGTPRAAYVAHESVVEAESALIGGLFYVGAVAGAAAVVASGGAVAAAIAAAVMAGGTGGFIGAALAMLVGDNHARHLQEQLDRGGLLLWVRTRDRQHEDRAKTILTKHAGHDVHLHRLAQPGA